MAETEIDETQNANKVDLYFDGELKKCTKEDDRNGEHLYVAKDGSFIKFPIDGDLEQMIAEHNEANNKPVEVVPDIEYGEVITHDKDGNPIT